MFWFFIIPFIVLLVSWDDIRFYFWNKKSDAEKYAEYQKFVNDWNGTDYDSTMPSD